MCGICGVYSTSLTPGEKDLFKKLLLLNVFRGKDSTGVIRSRVGPKHSVATMKNTMASPEFLFNKRGEGFIDDPAVVSTFIGHTRAATKGKVTNENAHPFSFPNVVGVHNGTINYSFEGSKDYETDSEALYALINEYGIDKALEKVSDASPAFALVFIDRREGTLNMIRNSKRPLFFSFVSARATLAWSSTKETLQFAIDNSAATTQSGWHADEKDEKVFYLKPYDLLTIKLGHSATTATIRHIDVEEKTWGNSSGVGATVVTTSTPQSWIKGTDGNYRTRAEEERRLALLETFRDQEQAFNQAYDEDSANTPDDCLPGGGGSEHANFRHRLGDLSELPWLQRQQSVAEGKKAEKTAGSASTSKQTSLVLLPPPKSLVAPSLGEVPLSAAERKFRLSCGCFVCGLATPETTHDSKIHWWSREFYACDHCFTHSDGDWVRRTIEDDWSGVPTVTAIN